MAKITDYFTLQNKARKKYSESHRYCKAIIKQITNTSYDYLLLKHQLKWAIIPLIPRPGDRTTGAAQKFEKNWITKVQKQRGYNKNTNGTGKLGEGLVKDVLKLANRPLEKVATINNLQPDIMDNQFVYEVKTRSWTVRGSAGEKVLGAPYKYADVPKLYQKPLKIICVAHQEYEYTYSKTKIWNTESESQQKMLNIYKASQIEFVRFGYWVKELLPELQEYVDFLYNVRDIEKTNPKIYNNIMSYLTGY